MEESAGFPSKKKKEEPEPEAEDVCGSELPRFPEGQRQGCRQRTLHGEGATAAAQEPGLVPDIPRDITPEELDALSALAAKLDGPIPEAAAEVKKEVEPPAAGVVPAAAVVESKSEVAAPARSKYTSTKPSNQKLSNQKLSNQKRRPRWPQSR